MAPHNRGSLENIPLDHDNGLRPVIRDHGDGNSGEVQREEPTPAVQILEQPSEESRFRYSRESPTNGSIHGVHSTEAVKTYPTIRVNHDGPVKIRVSCVNKNPPYKPHPHKIVGRRENCSEGVYTRLETITDQNRTVQLKNIGIQCTKREHIAKALQDRARLEVDPFGTGYDDPSAYTSIMLHYVRLAIEVFVPDAAGALTTPLAAVLSDVITDLPTKMLISNATPRHGSAHGGTQITMLTTKLPCNEIKVRFQDESAGWQVDVRPVKIHHLLSVVVDTPPYWHPATDTPAQVTIRLVRPATGDPDVDKHMVGEPYKYIYTPGPDLDLTSLQDVIEPKRQRTVDKVLLHPLQLDLDYPYPPTGNAPPEPQASTSTASLEINPFLELDEWFYEYMQQSQLKAGIQNSLNGMQPQPFIEIQPPNPSQGYSQIENYPRCQQSQESLERRSQTVQNHHPTGSQPSSRRCHQAVQSSKTGQQFGSHSQTRVIPSQHALQEPNNVLNDLLSLISPQLLIPQSSQSNLSTPNSITQKESLKRTHSQIDNTSPRVSHPMHSQTEIPLVRTQYSQTERPMHLSERPNSQNAQHSSSTASNPTGPSQVAYHPTRQRVGSQLEPKPSERPFQNAQHSFSRASNPTGSQEVAYHSGQRSQFEPERFTEIPPNQFEVFQSSNHLLIPEIAQATQPQVAQFPLIDLTEPEYLSERALNCDELRYFENGSQEYQENQQLVSELSSSNATSQVNQSSDDIEILSLSDELVKFCLL